MKSETDNIDNILGTEREKLYILSGGRGQGGKLFLIAICLLLYNNCLLDILHLFQRFNNFQTLLEYGETRLDKFTVIFL